MTSSQRPVEKDVSGPVRIKRRPSLSSFAVGMMPSPIKKPDPNDATLQQSTDGTDTLANIAFNLGKTHFDDGDDTTAGDSQGFPHGQMFPHLNAGHGSVELDEFDETIQVRSRYEAATPRIEQATSESLARMTRKEAVSRIAQAANARRIAENSKKAGRGLIFGDISFG